MHIFSDNLSRNSCIWSTQRSNSIFHVPMVAKFLDNKFLDISNFVDLLQYHLICQMLANLSGVVSESIGK